MSTIGLRSGKVEAGIYRCGAYLIKRGTNWAGWYVELNSLTVKTPFNTMTDAYEWARAPANRIERS